MTGESSSKTAPPVPQKTKTKKSVNTSSSSSSMSKLGKLPGLSITKSAADGRSQSISLASKSSLSDLSNQLKSQLRKGPARDSKDETPAAINKPKKTPAATKPSLPKSVSITSTRTSNRGSGEKAGQETSAKSLTVSGPMETETPAVQRKRLLELIAAERAEDEKKRRAKRSRGGDPGHSRPEQNKKSSKEIQNHNNSTSGNERIIKTESVEIPTVKTSRSAPRPPKSKKNQISDIDNPKLANVDNQLVEKVSKKVQNDKTKNVKLEKVDNFDKNILPPAPEETNSTSSLTNPSPNLPAQIEVNKSSNSSGPFSQIQLEILKKQFGIKDYLSRKEMRSLAKQTGLTDVQVRDWFKQKRIDEDVPTIIEEKPSEIQLNNLNQVKKEPLENVNDYGFELRPTEHPVTELPSSGVKKEPVEDENEPDSAVLDPTTGKLFKQRTVDKDMEKIMEKAPVLESLAKKIEEVNQKKETSRSLKDQVNSVIDILDDDIEITEEHIVNPGNKEQPASNILNKFLSQVEQLERNILDDNNTSSHFQLMKENTRLSEEVQDLSACVLHQQTETKSLERELADKNEEIESILLNSVSKETFVRNQFQSLISEVRQLRTDKADKKEMQERIKELEKQLRKKSHETEDWKEKYEQSLKDVKELEETSTNMIGEITKGIREKLAVAKAKEEELALVEEKNTFFIGEVSKLEKQIIQLNEGHSQVREDLKQRLDDKVKEVSGREQEIVKLKGQVGSLTKRFKEKVKEIQETLSKYNETLKMKNSEISERDVKISELSDMQSTQGNLITMLKDSVSKMNIERSEFISVEQELREKLKCCNEELQDTKIKMEEIKAEAIRPVKRKRVQEKTKERVSKARKLLAIEHSPDRSLPSLTCPPDLTSILGPLLDLYRFPAMEHQVEREIQAGSEGNVEQNWPLVPYYTHPVIEMLSKIYCC